MSRIAFLDNYQALYEWIINSKSDIALIEILILI